MAAGVIRPAGGLPAAAKVLLTPGNIRAGVHIKGGGVDVTGTFTADATAGAGDVLDGKTAGIGGSMIQGNIPVRTDYNKVVPMYATEPLILPAGYYANQITVTPTYNPGTVVTNFTSSGPFGSYITWGNFDSFSVKDGQIYMRIRQSNGQDHTVSGSAGGITFQMPVASGFKTAVFTGTGDSDTEVGFVNSPSVINNVMSKGVLNGSTALNGYRYISIRVVIRWVDAWQTSSADVNISKITFYP